MKSKIYEHRSNYSIVSKKLYVLMLLLSSVAGFAFAPPVIQTPTSITNCDFNNDGFAVFDLTPKIAEVLGALNPSLHTVTFHETATDAELGTSPIVPINAFVNITPWIQFIWVRVVENANPTQYSLTGFNVALNPMITASVSAISTVCGPAEVIFNASDNVGPFTFGYTVNSGPISYLTTNAGSASVALPIANVGTYTIILVSVSSLQGQDCIAILNNTVNLEVAEPVNAGEPVDLIIEQIPYVGTAVFDLTSNNAVLMNGDPNLNITYHLTQMDAEINALQIMNASAFSGTNGQRIWASVRNVTNTCSVVKHFDLLITNPDIVFIPDPNFKAKLLSATLTNTVAQNLSVANTVVDTNGDNEIQFSEALNISGLQIAAAGIFDLTGLEAFSNLTLLVAGENPVTSVNTPALPLLEVISLNYCNLASLDLSNNPLLETLACQENELTTLDLSANPLLHTVACAANQLTSLNVTGLVNLEILLLNQNQLTSLDTSDFNNITELNISGNLFTAFDLTGLDSLASFLCGQNQIETLDTGGCPNLEWLTCSQNQMTYLDVSQSPQLDTVDCSNNNFTSLDFSNNPVLCQIDCSVNPTLTSLNLKNGVDSCYSFHDFNDIAETLEFFCCDENEVAYFRNYFIDNGGPDVNVNSYCSFQPGGDFNTITVTTQIDGDNNGCDVNDGSFPFVRLNINDGTNSGAAFTDSTGTTQFLTQAGNFTITPAVENAVWFTISPATATIPFSNTNTNTVTQNFCIAPNGAHPDLEIVLAPLSPARPGFDVGYNVVVRNKGTQTISQPNGINVTYDADKIDFLSTDETPSVSGTGTLSWNLSNLQPFETKTIFLLMRVHGPMHPTGPVNNGDVLEFNATVNPIAGDELPEDNTFQLSQTTVGSFDPNNIVCLEGNIVSPIEIGNYLHYTINFENTGTAPAENIVVREVINTEDFDISSLQLLESSASVTTRVIGNVVEFIFPSINLHSGGHGNILIKVRSNSSLVTGDSVTKRVNIYFDYNFPVETLPENTLFQTLSNPGVPVDASISVYPNPTKGSVNISCNNTIKSVQLYDLQGRVLQTNLVNESQASIDISNQSNGVYFVKIISDKGAGVQKIVKE